MKRRIIHIMIVLTLLIAFAGCTKEKAMAIKVAASQFNSEAGISLSLVESILIENMAMPERNVKKITEDLEGSIGDFDYEVLHTLIEERDIGGVQQVQIQSAISEVKHHYAAFSAIFHSLDKGHLLADDIVREAEQHCMNLSMQLIILADYIANRKIETKLNSDRILLFENIKRNQAIEDPNARQEYLSMSAQNIVQLHKREKETREKAILQLLKTAEIGKSTAYLIRDYDKFSVNDLLTHVEETLVLASSISEQNKNVVSLLDKYKGIEKTIRDDEHWGPLLAERIKINE